MRDLQERKPLPPALPENPEDWIRQIKHERSLNDLVEDLHNVLKADAEYKALLYGVYDEQCVHGSISADNVIAAKMIQDLAIERKVEEVARQKLATIGKCLNVVLRRYGQSRKQRRQWLGGEYVPPEKDNGSEV